MPKTKFSIAKLLSSAKRNFLRKGDEAGNEVHNGPAAVECLEGRQLLTAWSWQDQQVGLDKARANFPSITGAGQTVAIIDEGTDYNHYALGGGLGNKVVATWNFDNNTYDVMPYDNNAHGTGTSGQIAADPHVVNGQLYSGIAPGAKIIALRANGTTETKAALDWIIANRAKYNIVAVNYLDFTGSVNESVTVGDMQALNNAGVFMAGAVGNYGPGPAYGHMDHLIYTVGSVNAADQLSGFTPRGSNLDFVAPGENVDVTWYNNGTAMDYPSNGTSWAGPQVTGTAALIKQINPSFTPAQIAGIIRDSAHWVYDGYSNTSYPRLDVNAALQLGYQRSGGGKSGSASSAPPPAPTVNPTPAPSSPSSSGSSKPSSTASTPTSTKKSSSTKSKPAVVTGSVPNGAFAVSAAPRSQGGLRITWEDNSTNETSFIIERATKPNGTFSKVTVVDGTAQTDATTGLRSYVDGSLKTSTTYYYEVIAVNAHGQSGAAIGGGSTYAAVIEPAAKKRKKKD